MRHAGTAKNFELEGIDPDGKWSPPIPVWSSYAVADIFAIALENAGQVWVLI